MADFVDVTYDEERSPLTNYPDLLTQYLVDRYNIPAEAKLLDVGCGRGEFLNGFSKAGLDGFGVDRSTSALRYYPEAKVVTSDIENDGIPLEDNFFDVVFSKSVIEHFYYPEKLLKEMFRLLKPGGLAIIMCPDWEFNYRIYFEDYTHRTPFMQTSLRDIHLIHEFENVEVERFRQLPILWSGGACLLPLAEMTRIFAPKLLKKHSKWVRFSKEIMLLSSATKPK